MSSTFTTQATRGLTVACAAFTVLLAFGSFASPAAARWGDDNDRRNEQHDQRDDHRDNRRDGDRDYRQDWNRDYRAPPVVYQRYDAPTYYAPPIVYGPSYDSGFGLNINIR